MAEVANCIGCGRDTYALSGICWRCSSKQGCHFSDKRGRRTLQIDGDAPNKTLDYDAEDDYSESSGPDSVFIEGGDLKHFQEKKRRF